MFVAEALVGSAAFDATLASRDRPVLVSLSRSNLGRLPAHPFFDDAMLPDETTLADLDDAVIYFDQATVESLTPLPDGPRFETAADVVELPVMVTDQDGAFVSDLRAEDFAVFEDGRRQRLTFFSAAREPVSLGILLDASGSMGASGPKPAKLDLAKASIARLVTEFLAPDDEFFLAWFGYHASLSIDWTTDRSRLRQALRDVDHPTGDTRVWDAVDFALPSAETGLHRKRALLILSDGRDTRSSISVADLRRKVTGSGVQVYAVGVEGDTPATRGERVDADALRRLTDDTGGRTEVVRGYARLDETLRRLAADLGAQYRLAYTPDGRGRDGWRAIQVQVQVSGRRVRIQTRPGYVGGRVIN
jgi:Ca-activated chloride channel family protein